MRLFKAEPERRALLLERLDHRRTLGVLSNGEAFTVAGELLRRLAIPAPASVRRLADVAAELVATLPARWERAGWPMGRHLVETACTLAEELGSGAGGLLIHTDLHDANILAGERGSHDETQPLHWLAIDPKGSPESRPSASPRCSGGASIP